MQYHSAERHGINFIITRNKKDYAKEKLKTITAREFMDMYSASE
jgi:hypothetical protein